MTNKNLDKAIHALINKVYDNTILLNLKNSSCSGIKNGVMEYVKRYKKRDNSCYIDNNVVQKFNNIIYVLIILFMC